MLEMEYQNINPSTKTRKLGAMRAKGNKRGPREGHKEEVESDKRAIK